MKSNRGVTLTSLIIYIIGLMIIIGIMSSFLSYFNKNVKEITIRESADEQYARFLSYLTKDINSENLLFIKTSDELEKDYIIFKIGENVEHQYIYENESIYYINKDENNTKKILLCSKVTPVSGKAFKYQSGTLEVHFKIMNQEFSNTLSVNI